MKMIICLISTVILTSLFSCDTYQGARRNSIGNDIGDRPNEPGKCYAKCLAPEIVEVQTFTFSIYKGDDPEIITNYVKSEVIEVAPASRKWIKKRADRNCHSADPNDCLVWCLMKEPGQTITVKDMLIDTTVTKEFITETHNVDYISQARNQTVWQAVVCDPSDKQLEAIQQALQDKGHDLSVELLQRNFGKASKKALTKYQQDNQLHVGGITEESMKALGVDY